MRESLQFERALGAQIIMLAPLAPHFASELWSGFVDHAAKKSTDFEWVSLQIKSSIDKEKNENRNGKRHNLYYFHVE